MGKVVKRIVLTGGPGAGKSSSIEAIKEYLENIGYLVYIVPEAATELDECGIDRTTMTTYDFQNIVLTYQLEREQLFEQISVLNNLVKDIILLYDRGLVDSKVYTKDDEEFDTLITARGINEQDILDRYDLIIFLETAAKIGAYTTKNNKARKEDTNEAIVRDDKTFDVWKNHRNITKIHAEKEFSVKKENIIKVIKNNIKTIKRKQNKYLINIDKSELDTSDLIYIKQYYLDIDDTYEHRLRKTTQNGIIRYYYTVQKKEDNGISIVIEEKILNENEFNTLLNSKPIKKEINKVRKYLVINGIKCNIDIYDDGFCILESSDEPIKDSDIDIIADVTNKKEYLNINLPNSNKTPKLVP